MTYVICDDRRIFFVTVSKKGDFLGVTKSMQEVQLTKKVKLLDSPGLVMAGGNRNDASVALRNAVKVSKKGHVCCSHVIQLAKVTLQLNAFLVAHFDQTCKREK